MEKTDKNVVQLTDDEILEGFRNANEHIVKEYFYGYCRVAYCIYDRRYDLQYKPGMDFYSLAHEYYLALCRHDFRQLEDRKASMSLKTWMVNGFRFLVLDKLKGLKKEQRKESLEEHMGNTRINFDVQDDEFAGDFPTPSTRFATLTTDATAKTPSSFRCSSWMDLRERRSLSSSASANLLSPNAITA